MSDNENTPEKQRENWNLFYSENLRPWRGVGKLPGLEVKNGDSALDIGCGNGKTVAALLERGALVTGLDFSEKAVETCKILFGDKASFVVSDCLRLPFPDESFDIITAVHVFEHLDSKMLEIAVAESKRVLKKGGRILIRSFAPGDMRSGGEERNVRGNGIVYHYHTLDTFGSLFSDFSVETAETVSETMRFGGVRIRSVCVFNKV